jgi:hypothetical protein
MPSTTKKTKWKWNTPHKMQRWQDEKYKWVMPGYKHCAMANKFSRSRLLTNVSIILWKENVKIDVTNLARLQLIISSSAHLVHLAERVAVHQVIMQYNTSTKNRRGPPSCTYHATAIQSQKQFKHRYKQTRGQLHRRSHGSLSGDVVWVHSYSPVTQFSGVASEEHGVGEYTCLLWLRE